LKCSPDAGNKGQRSDAYENKSPIKGEKVGHFYRAKKFLQADDAGQRVKKSIDDKRRWGANPRCLQKDQGRKVPSG
tara:strand:+ start:503 stop:730 length:228 start_codon:yes stop_codon:yes gene_type:complete